MKSHSQPLPRQTLDLCMASGSMGVCDGRMALGAVSGGFSLWLLQMCRLAFGDDGDRLERARPSQAPA